MAFILFHSGSMFFEGRLAKYWSIAVLFSSVSAASALLKVAPIVAQNSHTGTRKQPDPVEVKCECECECECACACAW